MTELSPELQDLAEMEGAAMCREMQRQAAMMARAMSREAVVLAMDLIHDPDRLQEYLNKFGLGEKE